MLSEGGEYCSTRLLSAGQNTNPWFQEASDYRIKEGDLVAIDTDMKGYEGYLCDISRTFLCGDKANTVQKEAYQVAYDYIQSSIELIKIGDSFEDFLNKAPAYPREYQDQCYSCYIHGIGDDDEPPFVPYKHDGEHVRHRGHFEENMVICVEFYAGRVGKRDGVKLEQQIHLTANGPVAMSSYPFESRLML